MYRKLKEETTDKYEAFISYRHKPFDIAAAKYIHQSLETYVIPSNVRKVNKIKRIGRIFRDKEELSTSSDLTSDIVNALENSKWLIAVCTPELPKSKWCVQEIQKFIGMHGRKRVLAVLANGEPEESFPDVLRFEIMPDGLIIEKEPLAADIRADGIGAMRKKLRTEKLRLLAPMLGVSYDDLKKRTKERFLKRVITASVFFTVFFAVFGSISFSQALTIKQQNMDLQSQIEETNRQRSAAEQNQKEAERQAGIAKENEIIAEQNEAEALRQMGLAQKNEALAIKNAEEAERQKNLANEREEIVRNQRDELFIRQSKLYAEMSSSLLKSGNRAGAGLLALKALPEDIPDKSSALLPEVKKALFDVVYWKDTEFSFDYKHKYQPIGQVPISTSIITDCTMLTNADGTTVAIPYGTLVRLYDTKTMRLIAEYDGYISKTQSYPGTGRSYAETGKIVPNIDKTKILIPSDKPKIIDAKTGELLHEGVNLSMLEEFGISRYSYGDNSIYDSETKEDLITNLVDFNTILSVSFNGRFLLAKGKESVYVYDMVDKKQVYSHFLNDKGIYGSFTFFSPDSKYLIITQEQTKDLELENELMIPMSARYITILRTADFTKIYEYAVGNFWWHVDTKSVVLNPLFSPDGTKALLPIPYKDNWNKTGLGLFDFNKGCFYEWSNFDFPYFATFSNDGSKIITCKEFMFVFDTETGKMQGKYYAGENMSYFDAYMSADEERIIALHKTDDNADLFGEFYCQFFDLNPEIDQEEKEIYKDEYLYPDGSGFAIRHESSSKPAEIWNCLTGKRLYTLEGTSPYNLSGTLPKVKSDGKTLVVSETYKWKVISFWDALTGEFKFEITRDTNLDKIFFSEDGERIIIHNPTKSIIPSKLKGETNTFETEVEVLSAYDGAPLYSLQKLYKGGAFDPQLFGVNMTRFLLTYDGTAEMYDLVSGELLFTNQHSTSTVAISKDSNRYIQCDSSTLRSYDATDGRLICEAPLNGIMAEYIGISPDGNTMFVFSDNEILKIYDAVTGQELAVKNYQGLNMPDPVFSNDSKYIYQELKIYTEPRGTIIDARTGEILASRLSNPLPFWEQPFGGELVYLDKTMTLRIPPLNETLETLKTITREYDFTEEEKLKYSID